jgi:hypothetical protein
MLLVFPTMIGLSNKPQDMGVEPSGMDVPISICHSHEFLTLSGFRAKH